jgi:hypothetical protein
MQRECITQSTFCATNFTNAIRMVREICSRPRLRGIIILSAWQICLIRVIRVEINVRNFMRENGEKLTIEIFRDLTPSS